MSVMNISNVSASANHAENIGQILDRKSNQFEALRLADSASDRADELEKAREALHRLPGLSERRAAEIRDRIQNGFYRRPDVLRRIAEQLDDDARR